ncbi:uncharacterized protein LOC131682932 [Topomyia yanbarensis]|uniref:uncharacterized protein LOC131682932 n=1 Tax=Topomyia yanbarensis TaxID=2498891 RepID=UPI00273C24ED|nr:uncharacterized protein LOC131682932 [Topomyia yanbarensis]
MSGTVMLANNVAIQELKLNSTTRGQELIVGSTFGSSCDGGVYRTKFYTWTGALVYYEYAISLHDYTATVDIENNQINLKGGLTCPYTHGRCLDAEEVYLTWDIDMNRRCEDSEFEVIFEGVVNKTKSNQIKSIGEAVVYSTTSEKHLFSIKTKEKTLICGHTGFKTDHPRILIMELSDIRSPFTRKPTTGANNDLFTYFNSKITFVENYIGQKLDDVYQSVMVEMCKLDKALMETKLTLARINPTEFVSSIIKRSGYTAVVAGKVLHVIECKPVYVTPRAEARCFQEIPVDYNNKSMFLAPVTRILQTRGVEIECTSLLPAKFMFGGKWYTADGRLRETTPPEKMASDIVTTWSYTPLPSLMQSGVYDADSLQKMRNMIYEQGDRRVATNVFHKVIIGQQRIE